MWTGPAARTPAESPQSSDAPNLWCARRRSLGEQDSTCRASLPEPGNSAREGRKALATQWVRAARCEAPRRGAVPGDRTGRVSRHGRGSPSRCQANAEPPGRNESLLQARDRQSCGRDGYGASLTTTPPGRCSPLVASPGVRSSELQLSVLALARRACPGDVGMTAERLWRHRRCDWLVRQGVAADRPDRSGILADTDHQTGFPAGSTSLT